MLSKKNLDDTPAAAETAQFLCDFIGANKTTWCYNHEQPTGASGSLHSDHVGRSDGGDQLAGRMILSFCGKKDSRYKLDVTARTARS
jgi:hypothetical protein